MASSMGATSEKLIDSAEFYLGVLKGEKQKFKDTLSRQIIEQVESKEQEIAQGNTDILSKKETIRKLRGGNKSHSIPNRRNHTEKRYIQATHRSMACRSKF
jgi:hypothetical protein